MLIDEHNLTEFNTIMNQKKQCFVFKPEYEPENNYGDLELEENVRNMATGIASILYILRILYYARLFRPNNSA